MKKEEEEKEEEEEKKKKRKGESLKKKEPWNPIITGNIFIIFAYLHMSNEDLHCSFVI